MEISLIVTFFRQLFFAYIIFHIIFATMKKEKFVHQQVNLTDYVEIESVRWTPEEIEKIAKERFLDVKAVAKVLKYNVLTFRQVAMLSGVSESRIRNAAVKTLKRREGVLSSIFTICNPFPDFEQGKMFILVDEKCKWYIKRSVGLEE